MSIRHKSHMSDTELRKYLWHQQNQNVAFDLYLRVAVYASPQKSRSYRCDLCFTKNLFIARYDPNVVMIEKKN